VQIDCRHPERCVVGHPFNPPHLVPLVEVVGGEKTGPEAIERALAFYTAIGKQPIHIRREVPGHVANRLQAALWREALHLVAEGVASVADIDTAISAGPGLRWALMGPHLTFHLAGGVGGIDHFLDQFAAPMADWWETLGKPTLTSELQERLAAGIAAETAGRSIAELASLARPIPRRSAGTEGRTKIAASLGRLRTHQTRSHKGPGRPSCSRERRHSRRRPKRIVKTDKTPMLEAVEWHKVE